MRMFALTFYFVIILLHIATSVEMLGEVMNAPKYGNLLLNSFCILLMQSNFSLRRLVEAKTKRDILIYTLYAHA